MTEWICLTHGINLEIEGNARRFSGLSWAGSPQCVLMTAKEPAEGKFGECEIRKSESKR